MYRFKTLSQQQTEHAQRNPGSDTLSNCWTWKTRDKNPESRTTIVTRCLGKQWNACWLFIRNCGGQKEVEHFSSPERREMSSSENSLNKCKWDKDILRWRKTKGKFVGQKICWKQKLLKTVLQTREMVPERSIIKNSNRNGEYQNIIHYPFPLQIRSDQSLSRVRLFATPWIAAHQASHQLPEFTQTHVHRISDAIRPSHPLSSPSPLAPNPSQHQSFPNESTLRMR